MATARFDVDPSRPYQLGEGMLAIWLPRGRGRDDRAAGLLLSFDFCLNPACDCTVATLGALVVDDRLCWAKRDRRGFKLSWEVDGERPPQVVHSLSMDLATGAVVAARGGELPAELAPFFAEPVPAWVLDDMFEEWAADGAPPPEPWFEDALRRWSPGEMLSWLVSHPEARPDRFVHEGRSYVVDFAFCAAPGCTCTANRFVVLEESRPTPNVLRWTQIAAAELDADLVPRRAEGTAEERAVLAAIFQAWRKRSGNAAARFAELRGRVADRGVLLHALAKTRAPAPPPKQVFALADPAPPPLFDPHPAGWGPGARLGVKQGRNDACACGSEKKFKRCCGA